MKRTIRVSPLGGARAVVLHRPHANLLALTRQLQVIGLVVEEAWPELTPRARTADFVFFDADMGYDAQFPWEPGSAPMPLIALIGSEAPGRIEWTMTIGADAQLLKPVSGAGVYSALLIARASFDRRRALAAEVADLHRRLEARPAVVRAMMILAAKGGTEEECYDQLRRYAAEWKMSFEDAALRFVARQSSGASLDLRFRR